MALAFSPSLIPNKALLRVGWSVGGKEEVSGLRCLLTNTHSHWSDWWGLNVCLIGGV